MTNKDQKIIEITRSFSWTVQIEQFSPRQFFCSQKRECFEKDAEEVSKAIHTWCKEQVIRDVNSYIKEQEAKNTINLDLPKETRKTDKSLLKENHELEIPY